MIIDCSCETLKEFLTRTDPVFAGMLEAVRHAGTCGRTRRTVVVSTRKYRSRKGRR